METDLGIRKMVIASALLIGFGEIESVKYNSPKIWMCEKGKLRLRIYNHEEELY